MRVFSSHGWLVVFGLLFIPTLAAGAPRKPIVAVFSIETKGVKLDASSLDRLTAYLSSTLAATGRYEVVPRDQVKKRLQSQKKASHKRCYDQSCQIEIGKELAAQKSLATQVIKLGTKCGITGTLFDLRRAAAERAATVRGGCSEDAIVTSLEVMVKRLAAGPKAASPASVGPATLLKGVTPTGAARLTTPRFAVDFRSTPPGASVFLNGLEIGVTNSRVNVAAGSYDLRIERSHYELYVARVTITGRRVFTIRLKPSPIARAVRAERTEFLDIAILGGVLATSQGAAGVFGPMLHTVTIKWRQVFWSILEGGFMLGSGGETVLGLAISRAGYPLYWGARGQHQLRFGLGLGFGGYDTQFGSAASGGYVRHESSLAFILSPTAEYRYVGDSAFVLGAGLRGVVAIGDSEMHLPGAFLLSLSLGFQAPLSWHRQ
ncbi:MAG: PEGA domain-containing protein [Deltaproteobacteria bacterium]|nr:PEGA domain-containing protein [Deltaproteobacteria bacterium]